MERRKLRPLVISMGGKRKEHIEDMFNDPIMKEYFEKPCFSPGVPQRDLRNSFNLIQHAGEAGIIPPAEWEILSSSEAAESYKNDPRSLFTLVKNVPVDPDRHGGEYDKKMSYSKELWQKAKGVNRGRSVLACTFAHLKAMKTLVEGDSDGNTFDFIIEDNVRAPISKFGILDDIQSYCEAARRIYETIDASSECEHETGRMCHLRYYGWLGSQTNLEFVLNTHCPRTRFARKKEEKLSCPSVFPFPITSDFEFAQQEEHQDTDESDRIKPGGTAIWGAYAYWISREGYNALVESLQKDVGAMLWRGKRMRCYAVKPIDKILPRRVMKAFSSDMEQIDGRHHVHVTTHPSFFRAPMLESQIHSQWDAEFCKSSEYQMKHGVGEIDEKSSFDVWGRLWLNEEEKEVVKHRNVSGTWKYYSDIVSQQETATIQN